MSKLTIPVDQIKYSTNYTSGTIEGRLKFNGIDYCASIPRENYPTAKAAKAAAEQILRETITDAEEGKI